VLKDNFSWDILFLLFCIFHTKLSVGTKSIRKSCWKFSEIIFYLHEWVWVTPSVSLWGSDKMRRDKVIFYLPRWARTSRNPFLVFLDFLTVCDAFFVMSASRPMTQNTMTNEGKLSVPISSFKKTSESASRIKMASPFLKFFLKKTKF
jgi:hypothetical protein